MRATAVIGSTHRSVPTTAARTRIVRRIVAFAATMGSLAAIAIGLFATQGAGAAVRHHHSTKHHHHSTKHHHAHVRRFAHARTQFESAVVSAVLSQLNTERRLHGLASLSLNRQLMSSARAHNLRMARANTLSHQLPSEPVFCSRMTKAGYHWSYAGENIAWNSDISTAGVLQVQTMMYNERAPMDGHRKNILSTRYHDVGVDVLVDRVHHKVWLTTDFGRH